MMEKFTQEERKVDRIRAYLEHELSNAERQRLEKEALADPTLAEEIENYRFLIGGFRNLEAQRLRQNVKLWEEDRQQPSVNQQQGFRWYYAAAAVALLLMVPLAYMLLRPQKMASQELYAAYFEPYQTDLTTRGSNPELSSEDVFGNFAKALLLYQKGDYEEALPLLEASAQADSVFDKSQKANLYLCLGVAKMNLKKGDEAIQAFEQIASQSLYWEHAQWYKGMVYLQNEDIVSARDALEALRENRYYGERVKAILEKMP